MRRVLTLLAHLVPVQLRDLDAQRRSIHDVIAEHEATRWWLTQ